MVSSRLTSKPAKTLPSRRSRSDRASGWRSSRRCGATSRMPSTWATDSWSAIPGKGNGTGRRSTSSRSTSTRSRRTTRAPSEPASFGFKVYPTIAEALRCGGHKLAVDAVLIIGEHGRLPAQREGADPLSALRVLPRGGPRLRARRPCRAGFQRQAPVVQLRQGQGNGRDVEAAQVPVPGRFFAAGHVAAAANRAPAWLRDRRGPDGRRRRFRSDGLPRSRGHAVHGRAARTG